LNVVSATLSLLFAPTIFERIFSYQASSRTALNDEPAFKPVPGAAGINFTIHALFLRVKA
jgi:hypothetical protein